MTDATNNPEQSPQGGGILRIKTETDKSGTKYRTMDIEELDKRAQMAEAAAKQDEIPTKKAADIILDIDEILDRHEQKSGKNGKTGNFLVDLGNTVNKWAIGMSPIGIKDRTAFFQLLSVMINAGIPLVKSLAILSEQMTNQRLAGIIANMMKLVDKGYSLSEAMNEHQKIFTEAQIGMVESAEASGQMNEILHQIAVEMEKSARINARVKGAMRYPMVIIGMLLLIGGLMMVMVVPKFVEIFTSSGVTLPMPTKILIFLSGIFVNYWIFGVIGLVGLYIAFQIWRKSTLGRYYFDLFVISLPIIGELARKISLSRFTRGLANLLRSGIPIVKALYIDAGAIGNEVYRQRIEIAAEDVKRGIPLGENLSGNKKLFPGMVSHMIIIGEQTAQLDTISEKIADFYDDEVDISIQSLSKIMEPLIMAIVGIGVGFMVAAIMFPILQLADITEIM